MRHNSRTFHGIGASGGVAIGRAYLLDRRRVKAKRYHIKEADIDSEVNRLEQAITDSYEQLEEIRGSFVSQGMNHHAILEAHEMMIRDPGLLLEATGIIREEHFNAEWAVTRVIKRLRGLFDQMDNPYIKERQGDLDFTSQRIIQNLTGSVRSLSDLHHLEPGTIIVAYDLSPADTVILARQNIAAFVTEVGGKTSHTSIIARSMDVPAAVGVRGIFEAVGSGDTIALNGFTGVVELRPSESKIEGWQQAAVHFQENWHALLKNKSSPARTLDGVQIKVAGNIEVPSDAGNVFEHGGEGIGLYRTEYLYLGATREPDEEEHYRAYSTMCELAPGHELTIRTLDLGADKLFGPSEAQGNEPNPVLGLRGIRYCLNFPDVFKRQLAGLLRAGVHGNIRILLPMISGSEEIIATKALINEVTEELESRNVPYAKNIPLGSMIEIPSAVIAVDSISKHVDFLSVGTNDLLQYLLAIDRTNNKVAYLYQPVHPAVLRSLQSVLKSARKHQIPISVCGEITGEIKYVPILLGLGFRELSMNAGAIPRVKELVRQLNLKDCDSLVEESLKSDSIEEIEGLVTQFLKSHLPERSAVWTPNHSASSPG